MTEDGTDEAVQGLVLGLRGANARDVVDGVTRKLDEERAKKDGKLEMAKNLKAHSINTDTIVKSSGLTREEIEKL